MPKIICAWCRPDQANDPDVTTAACRKHLKMLTRQAWKTVHAPRAFIKAFIPKENEYE